MIYTLFSFFGFFFFQNCTGIEKFSSNLQEPTSPPASPTSFECKEEISGGGINTFNSLSCLPQLDQINYWKEKDKLSLLDLVDVKIAVIDGFLNDKHVDLQSSILKTFSVDEEFCDQTRINDSNCFNVNPPNIVITDQNENAINHGTIISGLIVGNGKIGEGVVGVNPSAKLFFIAKKK